MHKTTKLMIALIGAGVIAGANAAIIDHGSYLTDTTSGLDWLDVTSTRSRSYTDVTTKLGAGQEFDGWRVASGDEFNALVGNYTGAAIASGNYGVVNQEPDKVDGLIALLGATDSSADPDYQVTWGFISDTDPADSTCQRRFKSDPL